MDLKRKMILTIFLLITASCSLLFSFPILAASRGITIETRTSSGVVKEIQLYSGYHALVVGCGDYRGGWPRLPNPVKDVHEVASMLTNLVWSVEILENPYVKTLEN